MASFLVLLGPSYSDYSSIETFTENGAVDYTDLFDTFEDAYASFEQDAGYILNQNLQDRSTRSGLSLAGWRPGMNKQAGAVEWFEFDVEYAYTPVSWAILTRLMTTDIV